MGGGWFSFGGHSFFVLVREQLPIPYTGLTEGACKLYVLKQHIAAFIHSHTVTYPRALKQQITIHNKKASCPLPLDLPYDLSILRRCSIQQKHLALSWAVSEAGFAFEHLRCASLLPRQRRGTPARHLTGKRQQRSSAPMGGRQSRLDRYYAGHEKAFERMESDLTKLQVGSGVGWGAAAAARIAAATPEQADCSLKPNSTPPSPTQPRSACPTGSGGATP